MRTAILMAALVLADTRVEHGLNNLSHGGKTAIVGAFVLFIIMDLYELIKRND